MKRTKRTESSTNAKSEEVQLNSPLAVPILQAAVKEGTSLADLAEMAVSDPAFSLRVLRVVNSSAFGLPRQLSDVRQATSLLGLKGVRNVALSFIVSDLLPVGELGRQLSAQALRRALLCRTLARETQQWDSDEAFSVGLLLDVGVGVTLSSPGTSMRSERMVAFLRLPSSHRVVFETAMGVRSHCETGAKLASDYGLPKEAVEAIEHHHDESVPAAPLAALAWWAEALAGAVETGVIERLEEACGSVVNATGVGTDTIRTTIEALPGAVAEAGTVLNQDVGPQPSLDELRESAHLRLVELNRQYEETVATLRRVLQERQELARRLQEANAQLEELAATDPLTSLPNRRAMEAALSREVARAIREQTPLSFALLDIDHFKRFNDTHGHQTGDKVLQAVAQVLKKAARTSDLAARFGGEEFCVVLPGADVQGAMLVARRLRLALERTVVESSQGPLRVTASFGVAQATSEDSCEDFSGLIRRADEALYRAKGEGRNRVCGDGVSPA